jgi:glutamate decarboxylase
MGMVLFRDENDLNYLKHYSNYIIRPDSVDLGRFTIEGSRAFTALKPWATLKIFGIMGFKLLFDHAFEITAALRGIVERHCNFEAMNQPELFIFNYRFVPKVIQERIYTLMLKIQDSENKKIDASKIKTDSLEKIERINNLLNELNIELHKETREVDDNFVSRTMYDSPQYFYQNVVVLRTILINPLTNVDVLKEIVDSHNRIGQKIYKADFAGRLEKI